MYFYLLLKTSAHTLNILSKNYLMSSLNRIEKTVQYSINNKVGVLHYTITAQSNAVMFAVLFVEMFSISCNTGLHSFAPLLNCTVNHSVIKTISLLLDVLAQLFHVLHLVPVNTVLQNPETAYSTGFRSEMLGGHSEGGMQSVRAVVQHACSISN